MRDCCESSGWCDKLSLDMTGDDGKFSKEQNTCLFTINVNEINTSGGEREIIFAYNDHNSHSLVNIVCAYTKICPSYPCWWWHIIIIHVTRVIPLVCPLARTRVLLFISKRFLSLSLLKNKKIYCMIDVTHIF